MAISANADFSYAGGFAAGTNTTTIIRANADLANVQEDDTVYNSTRAKYTNIVKKVVGGTNTTLTLAYPITSQTTTDSITFIPSIRVSGWLKTATASAGSATTITTSGMTSSAYVDKIIYIISGQGAGASAVIKANTTTVITVEAFYKPNTTGTLVTTVTPNNTSVFGICYAYADIVSALASYAAWEDTTSVKTLRVTKGIVVVANSGLGDYKKDLVFTYPFTSLWSKQTSFCQFGKFTNAGTGFDGGYIHMDHPAAVDYNQTIELIWSGKMHFLGCIMIVHKGYADTLNTGFRWNTYLPGIAVGSAGNPYDYVIGYDGVYCFSSEFRRITCTTWDVDIWSDSQNSQSRINIYRVPPVFTGTRWVEANAVIAGGQAVVMDGDIFDLKSIGEANSPAFARPLGPYQTTLANDHIYLWRPNFGNYALTNVCDWNYLSGGDQGRFSVGGTCKIDTKTTAGANLGTVALGVINTADGTGQIVTAKTGTNHFPTKSRFVTTDANGAYTAPYGVSEGILFHYAELEYGGGSFTTDVTDYSGYTLIATKYGYYQQVGARAWNYTNNYSETAYMVADPFVSATYANAIAYTGIAVDPAAKTVVMTSNHTIQELYDFIKARVDYEAKTNDVHVVDPITTSDGVVYTLDNSWTFTGLSYLTADGKILKTKDSGGTINGAYVNIVLTGVVNGSSYRIQKTSDGTELFSGTASGTTVTTARYQWTADLGVTIRVRKAGYLPFETTGTITQNGLSIVVTQIADTVYQA